MFMTKYDPKYLSHNINVLQKEFKEGDDSKNGCLKRYECCKSKEDNVHISGCEDRYDCCNKLKTADGCTKVH